MDRVATLTRAPDARSDERQGGAGRVHALAIAVRFVAEWHHDSGHWYRSHGNQNWAFDEAGFMTHRHASINDQPIDERERRFFWPCAQNGRRPDDHPGLSERGR